uniref:Tubulin monoglycylase TTLL3 n=1 Tax=Cyanistes caeruleus TaxID=156563 RepID=A0A8C0VJE0_CYACU
LDMEGKLNVWILKPGAESQGRGKAGGSGEHTEAPHLGGIPQSLRCCSWHGAAWHPLTQPHFPCPSARHLCNVSVQKWYKTSPDQDPRVPPDRIWSNEQFQKYLAQLGQADAWHQMLVPGMKAAILNTLRSAQNQVRFRKGSFELYGADFIVGEDFQPWLLEINSCPTMSPSSVVTRRLCANVQRDTLRLVLDRKDNPTCPIGPNGTPLPWLCPPAAASTAQCRSHPPPPPGLPR